MWDGTLIKEAEEAGKETGGAETGDGEAKPRAKEGYKTWSKRR